MINVHASRTLGIEEIAAERLHHVALAELASLDDLNLDLNLNRIQVVSLLHTRYPDMAKEIADAPDLILTDDEVAELLLQLIQEEAAAGINPNESQIWTDTENALSDTDDLATLEFLYGYELFKNKRILDAQIRFEHMIKRRKGPYQFALYYSALADLLQSKYDDALDKLEKVRNESRLLEYLPYYTAVAQYGLEDYSQIVENYSGKITSSYLHNIAGLTKIVAYSQFKLKKYRNTESTLEVLANYRKLTAEENYVLSTCLSKTGQQEKASEILASLVDFEKEDIAVSKNAKYDYALSLAKQDRPQEAIAQFESMLGNQNFDQADLQYNIMQLAMKILDYNKIVFYGKNLLDSKFSDRASQSLIASIDQITSKEKYVDIINSLRAYTKAYPTLKISIYNHAVAALQQQNYEAANEYFDLLGSFDPLIEERGAVAAWKGILAYHNSDYNKAQRLLKKYINSESTGEVVSAQADLDFYANYFLAYSYFKLKNHKAALGYFSNSLTELPRQDYKIKEDILTRIGDSYFLLDNYQEANRSYQSASEFKGTKLPYLAWQQAIIADLEVRPYDQLILLEKIVNNHPNSKYFTKAQFSTANTFFALGQYDKAARYYKQLQKEKVPTQMKEEAIVQLGLINVNAGDYASAENHFRRILKESSDNELQLRAHKALKEIYADYTYDTDAYLSLLKQSSGAEDIEVDSIVFYLGWNHFENQKYEQARKQWKKLLADYPQSQYVGKSYYYAGVTYLRDSLWNQAFDAFDRGTQSSQAEWVSKSYRSLLDLAIEQLDDSKQFLNILERYKSQFPDATLSNLNLNRAFQSSFKLQDFEKSKEYLTQLSGRIDEKPSVKLKLVDQLTGQYIQSEQWASITDLYSNPAIRSVINTEPKHFYFQSLAHMNLGRLDVAGGLVTDHYDQLLDDPAWLAKSILLLSDIYVAQHDRDSAIAALQALIETKSEVPPSLISQAKEKLQQLVPQN